MTTSPAELQATSCKESKERLVSPNFVFIVQGQHVIALVGPLNLVVLLLTLFSGWSLLLASKLGVDHAVRRSLPAED